MSLLQEIFKWSESLPDWQSDTVRRLFEKGTLSDSDLDDLTALAKASFGIPDPAGRVAKPLRQAQVPTAAVPGDTVKLLTIKNLVNVNAIAAGQSLCFSRDGLTAIYGDTGAGKSSYSRVLKRACRARDQEPVLPNVKLQEEAQETPQAVLEIEVNGTLREEHWREGTDPPPILSSFAVFDSRCARVYLDEENEVAFVPYGLDILTGLAKACTAIKESLGKEAASLTFHPDDLVDLHGNTAVGHAITRLPGELTAEMAKQLATLNKEENERLAVVHEALKQPDPAAQAKALGKLKMRLETAAGLANKLYASLSDVKVAAARQIDEDWRTAKEAAELAAQALTGDKTLLPGTGSAPWKKLFEAAREFSENCAYPGHAFPYLESEARCPLCQQELADGAERLRRFDAVIRDKTEQSELEKRQARERAIAEFKGLRISQFVDEPTLTEVREIAPAVATLLALAVPDCEAQKVQVLTAFDSGKWNDIEVAPSSPEPSTRELINKIETQIVALVQAANGDRAQMEAELRELQAREKLSARLPVVLECIARERLRQTIEQCARSINTYSISKKATELTQMAVTKDLADAINQEFSALQAAHLRVVLSAYTIKGATRHKLRLDLPRNVDLSKILSKGEQRAIALASFVAEASITPGNQGLVFDDPVSSLDHARREIVARRLAREATKRQVIVFTHDLYFLNLLLHEADEQGIKLLPQTVFQGSGGPGMTVEDLPFEGKSTKARIGQLRALHQTAEKFWRQNDLPTYNACIRDGYRMLRDSWERAVEEVLLNCSIMRFKQSIETKRLSKVSIEAQDLAEIEKGMTKCSNFSHDRPLPAGVSIPAPDEFRADVEALEQFRTRIDQRHQK